MHGTHPCNVTGSSENFVAAPSVGSLGGGPPLRRNRLERSERIARLYCGSRLRKGEVFAYVGLPHNLKDLKSSGLFSWENRGYLK